MTVNPGFEHPYFLPTSQQEIQRVRQMIERTTSRCDVEVDEASIEDTARLTVAAGANVLVAGRASFGENEEVAQNDGPAASRHQAVVERTSTSRVTRHQQRSDLCNLEWLVLEGWGQTWCGGSSKEATAA
jgi:hypothetical protein